MKKTFKFYTAMFLAKCANKSLKLLRRNASYFPGNLALKICPNFLEQILQIFQTLQMVMETR